MHPLSLIAVPVNRALFLLRESRRVNALEDAIKAVRKQHSKLTEEDLLLLASIYNLALFMLILERDFAVLKQDAMFAIRTWRKKWVSRQLAVLIYEASEDLPQLMGKSFRDALQEFPLSQAERDGFDRVRSELNAFKGKHQRRLKRIRTNVGAHRDHNATLQLEEIEAASLLELLEVAAELYETLRTLHPLIGRCLQLGGDPKTLLHHFSMATGRQANP